VKIGVQNVSFLLVLVEQYNSGKNKRFFGLGTKRNGFKRSDGLEFDNKLQK
jgi:hypothetical protein